MHYHFILATLACAVSCSAKEQSTTPSSIPTDATTEYCGNLVRVGASEANPTGTGRLELTGNNSATYLVEAKSEEAKVQLDKVAWPNDIFLACISSAESVVPASKTLYAYSVSFRGQPTGVTVGNQ